MGYEKIICGDNLERLKDIPDCTVDLCYIDPPFFSNKQYEVIWGDNDEVRSFDDRFPLGLVEGYIPWMEPRIREIHRVLKPTGSFYLHCDQHADAYLRVLCDQIFGYGNCRRQLIWKYEGPTGTKKNYPKKHDIIWFYTKGDEWTFNYDAILNPFDDASKSRYNKVDENGRRYKEYGGKLLNTDGTRRIAYAPDGKPSEIFEIPFIQNNAKERLGYPTQKPEALLERIIKTSSNEGDVVLDAFCGCGTALAVAKRLKRQFVGIDISQIACRVVSERLGIKTDEVDGYVKNSGDAAKLSHTQFQTWVVNELNGIPSKTFSNDKGIDGRVRHNNYPIQAKQRKIGRNDIDNFFAAMKRDKAKIGAIVGIPLHSPGECPSYPQALLKETKRLQREEGVTIHLYTVEDLVMKTPAADLFSCGKQKIRKKSDGLLDFNHR